MFHTLLIFFSLLQPSKITAGQVVYYCSHREVCNWNADQKAYSDDCDKYPEESEFHINLKQKLILHVTPSMESNYYIVRKTDTENGKMHIFSVVSDAGNEYVFWFDDGHKTVTIFAQSGSEIPFSASFSVKRMEGRN